MRKKREKYAYKTILIIHHVAWASHIIFLTTIIDGGGKNLIKMKPKFNIFALTSISSFHMGENARKLNWLQLWAAIVNILLFLLIAVWEFAVTKRKKKLIEEAFFWVEGPQLSAVATVRKSGQVAWMKQQQSSNKILNLLCFSFTLTPPLIFHSIMRKARCGNIFSASIRYNVSTLIALIDVVVVVVA